MVLSVVVLHFPASSVFELEISSAKPLTLRFAPPAQAPQSPGTNHESRSSGNIIFHANRTIVFCDNPARDRESQSGAALFRGEMRQKQPLFVLRRNSVPAVGNFNRHRVAITLGTGGHTQLPHGNALHRFRSIVN